MIVSLAQSLEARIASRSSSGVRNEPAHMPSDGNTSSDQMPSSSRSASRLRTSREPGAATVACMNSCWAMLGSRRRNT